MSQNRVVRRLIVLSLIALLVVGLAPAASARATWKTRIDKLIGSRSMSVVITDGSDPLYRHRPSATRAPASGEKLLLSMALLNEVPTDLRISTFASAGSINSGVINGNLWILGRGDPTITGGGRYGKNLPVTPTRMASLAKRIKEAGIEKVRGGVFGSTSYFARDWWAPGWKSDFPAKEVPLPSALTFEGNVKGSRHITDPELRAARSLTNRLEAIGVKVRKRPGSGTPPSGLSEVADVRSAPLSQLMRFMNRQSSNFFAEVLGKLLAVESGDTGTIANGAAAIRGFAADHGVPINSYDSSGLSYSNRISPKGFARLLEWTERQSWFTSLRSTLAGADQGTLEDRLLGVKLRAKTGTLTNISSLSGWVWLRKSDSWAAFSIMSNGLYKSTAAAIEDEIVREFTRSAQ